MFVRYLSLLALAACAPLTEQELQQRAEHEAERVDNYIVWHQECEARGNLILAYNPSRPCNRSGCIPHRMDWDFYRVSKPRSLDRSWRPKGGNAVRCVHSSALAEILNW